MASRLSAADYNHCEAKQLTKLRDRQAELTFAANQQGRGALSTIGS